MAMVHDINTKRIARVYARILMVNAKQKLTESSVLTDDKRYKKLGRLARKDVVDAVRAHTRDLLVESGLHVDTVYRVLYEVAYYTE